jgi:prepilin-type N-terminal cleavage/methylation domain-containing protein
MRAESGNGVDMRPEKMIRRGFTLIEIIVVVVVIGIIAGIAIPRMSRVSDAAPDSAVAEELAAMRAAIDQYQNDHNGAPPSASSAETFVKQMTRYTDAAGDPQLKKDMSHVLGPYLKGIPTLPVGANRGLNTVTVTGPAGTGTFGWYYDGTTIWINDPSGDVDARATPYNSY